MFKTHRTYTLTTGVKNNSIAVINYSATKLAVLYHQTVVVEKNGREITLRNGGWDTISTRAVINRALEQLCTATAYLHRVKGVTMLTHNGITRPFSDGMVLKVRDNKLTLIENSA